MAQSITLKGTPKVPGAFTRQAIVWGGDASYPNPSGYTLTPANFGLSRIVCIDDPINSTVGSGVWNPELVPTFDATGDYIQSIALHLRINSTGAEVANGVSVTGAVFLIYAEGN